MGKTQKSKGNGHGRVWSKEESAEFAAHLDSRGLTIIQKEQLERQNEFISQVTRGLNVSDPANNGRTIAVVWKDHLELLNTIAKVVLALGMAQSELDAALEVDPRDPQAVTAANEKVAKARTAIESLADHLADKEKAAREAVHLYDEAGAPVAAPQG